ncbi:hypothetical protein C8Q78DRAFT_391068 [Trametes maxima]|nr:hypothetical protein C8Q78DRAFT_391068 [Trametes maxima]
MRLLVFTKIILALVPLCVAGVNAATLEARQSIPTCVASPCSPEDSSACCTGASCSTVTVPVVGNAVSFCTVDGCAVACETNADCSTCPSLLGVRFTCQSIPGVPESDVMTCLPDTGV